MRRTRILLAVVLMVSVPAFGRTGHRSPSGSRILEVPEAFPDIQTAVDSAADGDTVLVSPGTYRENITVAGKSLTLAASGDRSSTVLLAGDPEEPVVSVERPFRGEVRIRGFLLLGEGRSRSGIDARGDIELSRLEVRGFRGTGIRASGRVGSCAAIENGTGFEMWGGEVIDCLAERNWLGLRAANVQAVLGSVFRDNRFLGLYAWDTGLGLVEGNLFERNGSFERNGGGMLVRELSPAPVIRYNIFRENRAEHGGAIILDCFDSVRGNVFENNSATERGGAIDIWSASGAITDNLFIGNEAPRGGAISIRRHHSSPVDFVVLDIRNCTFVRNRAREGAGIYYRRSDGLGRDLFPPDSDRSVRVSASIFSGNRAGGVPSDLDGIPVAQAERSNIEQAGFAGTGGNISADPRFVAPFRGDYHLLADSPCIDRGVTTTIFRGTVSGDPLVVDLDRNFRFIDGDGDGAAVSDMGPYEFSPEDPVRIGECNGDGQVNISDAVTVLLILFRGAADPPCLQACDADRDSTVRLTDAVRILQWVFSAGSGLDRIFDLGECRLERNSGALPCDVSTCP